MPHQRPSRCALKVFGSGPRKTKSALDMPTKIADLLTHYFACRVILIVQLVQPNGDDDIGGVVRVAGLSDLRGFATAP